MKNVRNTSKEEIRIQTKSKLNELSTGYRSSASLKITTTIQNILLKRFSENNIALTKQFTVGCFYPLIREVDIRPIFDWLRQLRCIISLPGYNNKRSDFFVFKLWHETDMLQKGTFNILEPNTEATVLYPNIVIVPLIAFDARCYRVGNGSGHYDKALYNLAKQNKSLLSIGCGFSCQEVLNVPEENHDVKLDMIVTEQAVLLCGQ